VVQAPRRYLLLTGARTWWDYPLLATELMTEFAANPTTLLVEGACPSSPDEVAWVIWKAWGGEGQRVPANWRGPCRTTCDHGPRTWKDTCPAAGQYRNERMVERMATNMAAGHPVRALAFLTPASTGAARTASLIDQAGIPLRTFHSTARSRPDRPHRRPQAATVPTTEEAP
jgi:hypothetical protein